MTLDERARATERVVARFRDKPFSWAGANCIRLARAQGQAMGHKLPPVPMFRTALGAKKALTKMGVKTVPALLDGFFARLPAPAFALIGDLCLLPGDPDDGGIDAVCIADGLGNLLGWHWQGGDRGLQTIKGGMAHVTAAWRL